MSHDCRCLVPGHYYITGLSDLSGDVVTGAECVSRNGFRLRFSACSRTKSSAPPQPPERHRSQLYEHNPLLPITLRISVLTMSELVSGIAKLNPFSKRSEVDDEDKGEAIDEQTVAGGGHASRESAITKNRLNVSHALRSFLAKEGVLSKDEAGVDQNEPTSALREFLDKPHIHVPPEVLDRGHPLPDYFISSSHNTYLMAHQLYGESHASAYETALYTGSRCVEIDAWDNDDDENEPKVTHGYTLVSHIPFRKVCEVIRDVVDKEAREERHAAPIIISLENHCGAHGQLRLVEIMREIFEDRLLSKAVREKGTREQEGGGEHVTLAELGNKVVLIVRGASSGHDLHWLNFAG